MTISQVKRQIKEHSLDKFYIFTGAEITVQSIYIHKICEIAGYALTSIESVADIAKGGKSLLSKPKCYICRDDDKFVKSDKTADDVVSMLGDSMLILCLTALDKRSKFYNRFSDQIVQFDYMTEELLQKYTYKATGLLSLNVKRLIQLCECDYGRILNESDKINTYWSVIKSNGCTLDKCFRDMVDSGAINTPPKDAIFDFVDAVMSNDCNSAFSLLAECNEIGEPALRLITVLYTNCRKLLQVQSCQEDDVESTTGLSSWDIKCVQKWIGCWDTSDLVYMLRLFMGAEESIKNGSIDDSFVMDYVMVNIF